MMRVSPSMHNDSPAHLGVTDLEEIGDGVDAPTRPSHDCPAGSGAPRRPTAAIAAAARGQRSRPLEESNRQILIGMCEKP